MPTAVLDDTDGGRFGRFCDGYLLLSCPSALSIMAMARFFFRRGRQKWYMVTNGLRGEKLPSSS